MHKNVVILYIMYSYSVITAKQHVLLLTKNTIVCILVIQIYVLTYILHILCVNSVITAKNSMEVCVLCNKRKCVLLS